MIDRLSHLRELRRLLRSYPVVGLLGPRQVGKTTLALAVAEGWRGPSTRFDLEDPADLARLADPGLALQDLRGLVVLDEIQRRPDLFPFLRVLADRRGPPARFLVLGSASPPLLRQSSESLAGRIAFHELGGLALDEVGPDSAARLWLRGGFPRSFLARTGAESSEWRRHFVRTFLERDLPGLGVTTASATLARFWSMLAHYHAQILNSSELARAFGVSDVTVRRYLDLLASAFVVRQLPPWHENLGKRQVKSPKIYLRDSGLLHALLGLETGEDLDRHPKVGASWEGFALDAIVRRLGARPEETWFWATHGGAELDLFVSRGGRRRGFEFKRSSAPALTPSMRSALADLRLDSLDVIYPGDATFALAPRVRAVGFAHLLRDVPEL
ncbi:MAG: ATP-binding protein [Planctomycetes bacterium]|nr:ATP-binding protein [Planctomycetota bacterium]